MDPDQPSFRQIRTNKGGQKLLEGGYQYLTHRRVGKNSHWQCEQRGECKARVHTKGMEIVKRTNEHLHAPDVQATACCEIKASIKRKARDTQDSSHQIIGEGMLTASEGTAAKLPKLDSLKRTIQRQRASVLSAPVQPTALAELVLPAEYQRDVYKRQLRHIRYFTTSTYPSSGVAPSQL
ncbi:hypothetical protein LOD99_10077 [Oopsacas minuta]|uniref:FLYWCH-type domain-containing protein n=1 Tax=Oopsacas minuta TaxID=111878 RepID=A0AAV7KPE2_9METZ|nr:hypothetical protein LOD99_10077 [Oopsacas minuta]